MTTTSHWSEYQQNKTSHARDRATEIGVSEAELVASGVGQGVTRLREDWAALWQELPQLGAVKTLTRNDHIVLEHWGSYAPEGGEPPEGPLADVRLFFRHWGSGFAVEEPGKSGVRHSLQFFDRYGDSVHKIYLEDLARREVFQGLTSRFSAEANAPLALQPKAFTPPPGDGDAAALQAGWDELKDTHDFVMLLARLKLARVQALHLAGPSRARPVGNESLHLLLTSLAEAKFPFMIFVASRGLMQIYSGTIDKLKAMGDWINVLDPGFNLHARETGIAYSFIVRKPTSDGIVTSLELYDQNGETLALLFSKRSFGTPESDAWRALLAPLESA
jgi:putative hemin transport protein